MNLTLELARWSRRQLGALWGAGLLLEAALLLAMFAVLVPPEPLLMAHRRGGAGDSVQVLVVRSGDPWHLAPPAAPQDSFYTALRWPPGNPFRGGGGHVVALPVGFWWCRRCTSRACRWPSSV